MTVYGSLGKCHKNIARSDDLIDLLNALSAISKCCDRLRTADLVDLIYAGFICGN